MRTFGALLCGWVFGGTLLAIHYLVTPLPLAGWIAPIGGTVATVIAYNTFPRRS